MAVTSQIQPELVPVKVPNLILDICQHVIPFLYVRANGLKANSNGLISSYAALPEIDMRFTWLAMFGMQC